MTDMIWRESGKWSIKSGDWAISKAPVGGEAKYMLWHGQKQIGVFGSADEAKRRASEGGREVGRRDA